MRLVSGGARWERSSRFVPSFHTERPTNTHTHTHTYVHHTPRLGKWVRWMLTSDDSPEENCGYQNSHRIRKVWLLQEITLKWRAGSSSHTHTRTHTRRARWSRAPCVCVVSGDWDQIKAQTLLRCQRSQMVIPYLQRVNKTTEDLLWCICRRVNIWICGPCGRLEGAK